MKLVLLSGGSGKRLWPLSNDTRSKQFLKVLEGQAGEKQSMVQRVWNQITRAGLGDSSLIATSKIQKDMIYNQIGNEVPLIIEPERRDTFPAIALAASYLHSIQKVSDDEVIVVLPVDPFVEDAFFEKIKELESLLKKTNADLALIGVKPTYPSSKYGYIIPEKEDKSVSDFISVKSFYEKPDENRAEELINAHGLWNTGVFAFKLKFLMDIMKDNDIFTDFDKLIASYSTLPKISFDYEVVENANDIVATSYSGNWKDLGTWNTLTEEMATSQIGKGIISDDSRNTHLVNELDIPVAIIGLQDVVVAASPDGILVSDKSLSPNIKSIVSNFNHPPMYEERIWGWSRTLDYATYENGQEMVTKRICINEGKNSSYHFHKLRDEVWTIVRGEGELAIDDTLTRVKAGDIIHLPAGKKHGIRAISHLEFIEVQTGSGVTEQDFVRILFNWDDVINQFSHSKSKVIV